MARKKTTRSGTGAPKVDSEESVEAGTDDATEMNDATTDNMKADDSKASETTDGGEKTDSEIQSETPDSTPEGAEASSDDKSLEIVEDESTAQGKDDPSPITDADDVAASAENTEETADAEASIEEDAEVATSTDDDDTDTNDLDAPEEIVSEPEAAKDASDAGGSTTSTQQSANPAALVFGGVVAGAIGFAAAYFGLAQQSDPAVKGLSADLSTLREEVSSLAATPAAEPDLTPILAQIEDVSARLGDIDAQFETTQGLIDAVNARIDSIEVAAASNALSEGAQDAFASELQAARDAIAAERAALAEMMAEAQTSQNEATEVAKDAVQRAAISEITTALDTGATFDAPLADLAANDVAVPENLLEMGSSGVVTMAALQDSFPDAARDALASSRSAAEGTSGFYGFFQAQLGVRSLEPKEGDDPDAVLSRAEAALENADLTEALAEIETLPPEALTELADWVADASKRRDAMSAVQDLSDSLN